MNTTVRQPEMDMHKENISLTHETQLKGQPFILICLLAFYVFFNAWVFYEIDMSAAAATEAAALPLNLKQRAQRK